MAAAVIAAALAGCGARVSQAQIEAYRQQFGEGAGVATGNSNADANQNASSSALGSSLGVSGNTPSGQTSPNSQGQSSSGIPSGSGNSPGQSVTEGTTGTIPAGQTSATSVPGSQVSQGLAVASSVCRGLASGPGVTSSEIDIGNVSTITGPVPGLFIGAVHGITAFAAYINSIGGICNRRLVVKGADDNLDASQNATATESLAGSVLAFVGSFSADDQGGAAVLQSDAIPDIGEALSTERFELPNNFSPEPKPPGYNLAQFIYLKKKNPVAALHMAVLTENQPTDQALTQAEVQAMESIGYKFVYQDNSIEPTQTDFTADVEAMKADGAQGVVFYGTAPYYGDLSRAIQDVGLSPFPDVFYGTNAYDAAVIADAGDSVNGDVFYQAEAMYQGEDSSIPTVALFDKWYRALYGTVPDEFANFAWMSGILFIQGLNAGGGLTRPALLKGLDQVTNFTADGLVATDNPAGKKPPYCYLLIDVDNGRFVRDPADPATGFDCTDAPDYYYVHG
jgi:ABC-type branched-subunit amino acid transport system substrate-binding protein